MKISFKMDGAEHVGEAQNLSVCGVFVLSEQQSPPSNIVLDLMADDHTIQVSGNVVQVTNEGFAVAFRALQPKTLVNLHKLLNPNQDIAVEIRSLAPAFQEGDGISVQAQGWSPPVTEPILHEWKPEGEFVTAPEGNIEKPVWENMPTLSPQSSAGTPASALNRATPDFSATPLSQAPAVETPAPEQPPQTTTPQPAPEERRETERVEQSIPVSFDNVTSLIKEFTHNISFGGLFVLTDRPMEREEKVDITLIHPTHGERLTLQAKVAHVNEDPRPDPATGKLRYGVGVEFLMPLKELKQSLSDFISARQEPRTSEEDLQIVTEAKDILERGKDSHYDLLGVDQNVDINQIRMSYFSLVDRFHPDRFFGKVSSNDQKILEELFRKLTKAYEELSS
jgi:Tfp pilus assembly protein PilZ